MEVIHLFSDDDDDTLKDDEDNDSQATDISHTTELLVDDANIVVSSPAPTPRPDDKLKLRNKPRIIALENVVITQQNVFWSINLRHYEFQQTQSYYISSVLCWRLSKLP